MVVPSRRATQQRGLLITLACRNYEVESRGDAELAVHVPEVGLRGVRRDEKSVRDVSCDQPLDRELDNALFRRRERVPPERGTVAATPRSQADAAFAQARGDACRVAG